MLDEGSVTYPNIRPFSDGNTLSSAHNKLGVEHLPTQPIHYRQSDPPATTTMRLTAELVQNSLSYLNPLKERELDLRGAYKLKRADTTL